VIGVAAVALVWASCYLPPITSPIVDPFRAPACAYCPGNRGLEYELPFGSQVRAAAGGVITFSGVVAGVRYVVVEQADHRWATYGRLAAVRVVVGATVGAGDIVGTTTDRFYFGLREGDRYVDPAPFLGAPRYRPRLIPVDGSPPRRAPPPTLECAASSAGWASAVRHR
jgi:murein DD-endopeptidase MepM/ murein hydrolase activator NlpD